MGDFKESTTLLEKSRGISPVLVACPISDAQITQTPADEEPLCGNAAVYTLMIMITIMITIMIMAMIIIIFPACQHTGIHFNLLPRSSHYPCNPSLLTIH